MLRSELKSKRLLPTCYLFFSVILLITACGQSARDVELPILDAIGGDFSLPGTIHRDDGTPGAELSLSSLAGQVVLLNFGYTYCPDVCPTVLSRMARLSRKLKADYDLGTDKLTMVFISVDPERDSLKHLQEYLAFFSPDLIGVRGSMAQTQAVTKQYAVYFEKKTVDSEDYTVMHSDKIFLLDKLGRLRALYGNSDSDETVIDAILSVAS